MLTAGTTQECQQFQALKEEATPEALRKFVETAGVAKRENVIEMSLLEFCVRRSKQKKQQANGGSKPFKNYYNKLRKRQ